MKNLIWLASLSFALVPPSAYSQDKPDPQPGKKQGEPRDKFRPGPDPAGERELTPEETRLILEECRKLMAQSAQFLNDSSRGKALGTEKELIDKIDRLLQKDSADLQERVLEIIQQLMGRTEKSQGDAVEKLADVIRRARAEQGQVRRPGGEGKPEERPDRRAQRPAPNDSARLPYDPNRKDDPANTFRFKGDRTGRWGDLPPRLREAMLLGKRDLDDFPLEFQEPLKEYFKAMLGGEK